MNASRRSRSSLVLSEYSNIEGPPVAGDPILAQRPGCRNNGAEGAACAPISLRRGGKRGSRYERQGGAGDGGEQGLGEGNRDGARPRGAARADLQPRRGGPLKDRN